MTQISLQTWHRLIDRIELPIPDDEIVEAWEAADPHQAEILAALWSSAMLNRVDADRKNPFNSQSSGSFYGSASFDTWAHAIEDFIDQGGHIPYTSESLGPRNDVRKLVGHIIAEDTKPEPEIPPDPEDPLEPRFAELREWFGPIRKYQPTGPVSQAWLAWCRENGVFPQLIQISGEAGRTIYSFANGLRILWDGKHATPIRLIRNDTDASQRLDPG